MQDLGSFYLRVKNAYKIWACEFYQSFYPWGSHADTSPLEVMKLHDGQSISKPQAVDLSGSLVVC